MTDLLFTYSDLINELEKVYAIAALHADSELHYNIARDVMIKGISTKIDNFYEGFHSPVPLPQSPLETYAISVDGCDDSTIIKLDLSKPQYAILKKVADEITQTSTYVCMPKMKITKID